MHVVRGSGPDPATDRRVVESLPGLVENTGEAAIRAWTPHRQVAFGRRDTAAEGYDHAREVAESRGFLPVEREVGGRAVAYTGETVAFAYVVPNDEDDGVSDRYEDTTALLERTLESLGVTVHSGEPEGSFCPGDHSLQHDGKIAGIAQRVRRTTAVVGGCLVVSEADERAIAEILDPIYDALGVRFDPDSVGSIESAGGLKNSTAVVERIETTFAGDKAVRYVDADDLL